MLKTYEVEYMDHYWKCKVEIDEDFVIQAHTTPDILYNTTRAMEGMILFWHDGIDRLEENDGLITKTFLAQLAREVWLVALKEHINIIGVLKAFENREGWAPLDGSWGIKLIEMDDIIIHHYDFLMEEIK